MGRGGIPILKCETIPVSARLRVYIYRERVHIHLECHANVTHYRIMVQMEAALTQSSTYDNAKSNPHVKWTRATKGGGDVAL